MRPVSTENASPPHETMQQPLPERPSAQPTRRGSRLSVVFALIFCLLGAAVLLALPTGFIGPVMVFGGLIFFGVIGFHYFVWGRWLGQILRQEQQERGRDD